MANVSESFSTHDFWRLPMPSLADLSPISSPRDGIEAPAGEVERDAGPAFWRLPLPSWEDEAEEELVAASVQSAHDSADVDVAEHQHDADGCATAEPCAQMNEEATAAAGADASSCVAGGSGSPCSAHGTSYLAQTRDLLHTCGLAARSSCQALNSDGTDCRIPVQSSGEAAESGLCQIDNAGSQTGFTFAPPARCNKVDIGCTCLPAEVVSRALCNFDCKSLLRSGATCAEWARLTRSKNLWRNLFKADWGLKGSTTRAGYRQQFERWRMLQLTLNNLKGRGHPGNAFGSTVRRQLYKALETLVEFGAADNPVAAYPAKVPDLLRRTQALETLLALLEDESPHLLCLALRCLSDLAADADAKPALLEAMSSRATLVRSYLEGDDKDLIEAGVRLVLNLQADAVCTPLSIRRRGPLAFIEERRAPTPTALAATWAGVWSGEMRYTRGGQRHAGLRLVLGFQGDPVAARIAAQMASWHDARAAIGALSSPSNSQSRLQKTASFWEASTGDFLEWCSELSLTSEEVCAQLAAEAWDPNLTGAGWDQLSGSFTVEACLPAPAVAAKSAASGVSSAQSSAVPVKLVLRYEDRMCACELVGFLSEGSGSYGERVCALYGIWGTLPAQQRHLFVLQKVASLPVPEFDYK